MAPKPLEYQRLFPKVSWVVSPWCTSACIWFLSLHTPPTTTHVNSLLVPKSNHFFVAIFPFSLIQYLIIVLCNLYLQHSFCSCLSFCLLQRLPSFCHEEQFYCLLITFWWAGSKMVQVRFPPELRGFLHCCPVSLSSSLLRRLSPCVQWYRWTSFSCFSVFAAVTHPSDLFSWF